ncbi:MAG: cell division protein ZapE [Rhodoglobus sp.]|uniref:Cell division protein ZapE n=1 Tax=Microbacterium aurugineum TaxID=2851642 RepID=A0ABY4IY59_9MICO|nr:MULTISPECIES: cell division protein ZapE [Microbacterium]MDZ4045001.1 cell division protein ZapE [Rhodoglobus sp.]PKQ35724.1 MAG: cell division protein ZapE [Actinobacteria bacterium HGW-Actinobacteria-11]QEA29651.1 cell division protein ZapE [Microbacterium sp. CBA3102]TFB18111.1 cell division protein ZapE [Microbacterium sp. 3H14]UPL17639.1 cell division protein ZapE [Microbacterium aurugineum]
MTDTTSRTVHLTDRQPTVTGPEMLASLVPPPQFDTATFDSYRADPAYPSQEEAKETLMRFAGRGPAVKRGGLFSRAKKEPELKPGVYLDGGFGVGKTHLLASIYHAMPARRKYFGSFIEYTALVGALGYKNTVDLLKGADLLCIDEFELDDPGDTMVMTRLIGELVPTGTRLAATSNTPPNALGEGRFAAQDFLREIHAMSDSFQTLRIDGVDFRQRAIDGHAVVLDDDAYEAAAATADGTASDDRFDDVIRHLAQVHPSRYIRVIEGLDQVGLRDVHQLTDQSEALRFVAFVDRVYDAQIPVIATGLGLDSVFSEEMLAGGYRKKYLRAVSRLNALTHSA